MESLAKGGETPSVEFKQSTSKGCLRAAVETLCAMLNGGGGTVLFGVADDGRTHGQEVRDSTHKALWDVLREIDPASSFDVTAVPVLSDPERCVIAVSVEGGFQPPYRVRGKAYKRVATSTVAMTEAEAQERVLEAAHGLRRWETERVTTLRLDVDALVDVTRRGVSSGRLVDPGPMAVDNLLRGFGLLREDQPIRAAAVLFGQKEYLRDSFPQCRVRLGRFRGLDKTEFIDQRQETGNIFELLRLADEFLRIHLPVAGRVVGGVFERQDDPIYPPEALREALVNAFCHRDYANAGDSVSIAIFDDRLEITSPGGLHFGLTVTDLYEEHESKQWNQSIADVLYRAGYIENWGRGTLRMAQLTEQAGQPRPEFVELNGALMVRFRSDEYVPPARIRQKLSERHQNILRVLSAAEVGLRLAEIAEEMGVAESERRSLQSDLQWLKRCDLVESHGHAKGARWFLAENRPV